MVRTRTPGIFKRGSRYVVTYRHAGRLKKESARTLDEARKLKATRSAQVASGEFSEQSRVTLKAYADEWLPRYAGKGSGFRESTRGDYRRVLDGWVFESVDEDGRRRGFFSERVRLAEVTPRDVAGFIDWLVRQESARGTPLTDSTIRNILNPLRALFGSAVREGLVRHSPTTGLVVPHRPTAESEEREEVRPLTPDQLAAFLTVVHPGHRAMFRLLAATGLRVGELLALQWRHLRLDGSRPVVRVRRTLSGKGVAPPKSRHGRREVPLDHDLVSDLRGVRADTEWPGDEDLVFPSGAGNTMHYSNVLRRVLKPAAEEAGAPWAGFHTFRHTFASLHIARGTNVVQLSRLLGHHSAAFTLTTYVHLIDGDVGEPLALPLVEPAEVEPLLAEAAAG